MENKNKDVYELLETHVDIDRGSVWQYIVKLNDSRIINLAPDEFNKMREVSIVNRDNNKIIEKSLEDEYNLRNKLTLFSEERFILHHGNDLEEYIDKELIKISGHRRDFKYVYDCISDKDDDKIVLMNGIRRTGKTVMMYQCIQKLVSDGECDYDNILLIIVNSDDLNSGDFFELIHNEIDVWHSQYKYVFVDEISRISGLNSHGQYLYDAYHRVAKFILTGTHSYTLPMLYMSELATRSKIIDVMPVSYEEYTRLVEDCSVLEYMRFGGIFTKEFISKEKDGDNTKTGFVWTAISRNIAASINRNGVDRDMMLKGMDVVQIDTVVNRIIYNSLNNIRISLFTSEFNPQLSLGGYRKIDRDVKRIMTEYLDRQISVSNILSTEDRYVLDYAQRVLTEIGIIDWVSQSDDTKNKGHQYTRFVGLLYSICESMLDISLYRDLIGNTVTNEQLKEVIDLNRMALEGIVLETFIASELNSYYNRRFGSTSSIYLTKLRYDKKVEIDIIMRNGNYNNPLKKSVYIEVKRGNYYRSTFARWLVDKSTYSGNVVRIVVYNGPSCKVNPREDKELMDIKIEDSKQTTSNAQRRDIPMGFDERCEYIYLVNVREFLKDIGRYVDEDLLLELPEYNFKEGHVGELIPYSEDTPRLLRNMNLNFNNKEK